LTTENQTPNPALSLQALHEAIGRLIEQGRGEWRVGIPYQAAGLGIGRSPSASVTAVNAGFDWDHGTVFLATDKPLSADAEATRLLARNRDKLAGKLFMVAQLLDKASDTLSAEDLARLKLIVKGDKK
jgi:hypothetical protein